MISREALAYCAGRALNTVRTEAAIDWAMTELCNGKDTPTLRILAGLSPQTPPAELESYFRRACNELRYEVPSDDDVVYEFVVDLARQYREGAISRAELVTRTYQCWSDTDDVRIEDLATTLDALWDGVIAHAYVSDEAAMDAEILNFLTRAEANPKSKI
ncbi:MAG TPA: hypothetical protein VEJ63_09645 [Planctomycetota bacterium]|nr:hypothetical protein [Planctomycetota bacterium]